jgi:DNA polymerase/3'-5' exonuclease PolX
MKSRRPRAEVAPIVDELTAWAAANDLHIEFGGSWRRQSPTVGDLDVVIFCDSLHGVPMPPTMTMSRSGDLVAQGEMHGVQVDLWACPPECAGPFLWFITGPRELNIAMRAQAKRLGYKLSQMGLDGHDGPIATEADIAAALRLPHLTPPERDRWSASFADGTVTEITGSKGDTYHLTVSPDGVSCTCPGWRYRRKCKHATAALEAVA